MRFFGRGRGDRYKRPSGDATRTGSTRVRAATNDDEQHLEQFVATHARQNGFAYGLVTAFMALMTGWMASIVFRKD